MICGIDPGKNGGIAFIDKEMFAEPMPKTANEIDLFKFTELLETHMPKHVVIEHVHALYMVGAKQTFNFGTAFGMVLGVVSALKLPYSLVPPKTWQKEFFTGMPAKQKAKDKSKLVALRLFPKFPFDGHDGMIDAALIAEYGRRMMGR